MYDKDVQNVHEVFQVVQIRVDDGDVVIFSGKLVGEREPDLAVADDDEGKQDEPEETPETPEAEEAPKPVGTTVVIVSEGGKVNIRVGNGTSYSRITSVAPGTTFEYVATAANGWHAVIVGAKVGWVSGKYSRII